MSRRPAAFTEADIKRARKAAPDCTIEIVRPGGTIIRLLPGEKVDPAKLNPAPVENAPGREDRL
jgi:hypothetical protein